MRSLSSITKRQWIVIIGLELAAVVLYLGVIPWLFLSMDTAPPPTADLPVALESAESPVPTAKTAVVRTPTRQPTVALPTSTIQPAAIATSGPTALPAPSSIPIPSRLTSSAFADWELNPHAELASKTTFFTSACFGVNANPLQDRDYMAPADWSSSPGRSCIFGYDVNPADGMPTGRYSVSGGPDGQPRFYLIPPEAFAKDQQSIKTLSELHIIVEPEEGCDSLGLIGITADGRSYQTAACNLLKPGGAAPGSNGLSLVLPTNANNILNPDSNGGAYGFIAFPAVIFRRGFSLYFTGKAGYAPSRTWFESAVDTLLPNVRVKTTAEMTDQEVKEIASRFDGRLAHSDPISQLAGFEREAQATSTIPVQIKSKQAGEISFAAAPGTVLSSVAWRITPQNNVDQKAFLETNLCLDMNGEESCFTGVEDFAHCAFFTPCITGYSRLDPIEHGGYIATRYFPAGTAPILRDGHVTAKFLAPDTGVVLEVQVTVRVRSVDVTP